MINRILNIISFNVPYPPNYGGIIDVFYKIESLSKCGVQIHLHCFDYGRGTQKELEKLCSKVYYYKRKTGLLKSKSKVPYIINSRSNSELLDNLVANDYPILFEGLHTTYFLNNEKLANRIKIVRTHNVEHNYYKYLALQEKNYLKRLYFLNAAKKLKKYEPVLNAAAHIASISPNDFNYFSELYKNTFWLPPFHPDEELDVALGTGNYALYHGNLSVPENIKAVLFLINIFSNNKDISLIIAGKNPDKSIVKSTQGSKNIKIVPNPSEKEMIDLITEAQVHLLPTFQPTGIKLKLIASLFKGRHCIVNNEMVMGTGLEKLCHIANSDQEFLNKTTKLMQLPFESQDLILRKEILSKKFHNSRNAELLISKIFDSPTP